MWFVSCLIRSQALIQRCWGSKNTILILLLSFWLLQELITEMYEIHVSRTETTIYSHTSQHKRLQLLSSINSCSYFWLFFFLSTVNTYAQFWNYWFSVTVTDQLVLVVYKIIFAYYLKVFEKIQCILEGNNRFLHFIHMCWWFIEPFVRKNPIDASYLLKTGQPSPYLTSGAFFSCISKNVLHTHVCFVIGEKRNFFRLCSAHLLDTSIHHYCTGQIGEANRLHH